MSRRKKNIEEKLLSASVFFESDEASKEEVFNHIYDTEKYSKFLNIFPIVWIRFDKKYQEVGCTGTIRFLFPPFHYKMQVVKVVPNEYIELECVGKTMKGRAMMKVTQKPGGVLYEEPHWLAGTNSLINTYYWKCLAPNHANFMKWRYTILKKNLAKNKS